MWVIPIFIWWKKCSGEGNEHRTNLQHEHLCVCGHALVGSLVKDVLRGNFVVHLTSTYSSATKCKLFW